MSIQKTLLIFPYADHFVMEPMEITGISINRNIKMSDLLILETSKVDAIPYPLYIYFARYLDIHQYLGNVVLIKDIIITHEDIASQVISLRNMTDSDMLIRYKPCIPIAQTAE